MLWVPALLLEMAAAGRVDDNLHVGGYNMDVV